MNFKHSYIIVIMSCLSCGGPDQTLSPEERTIVDSLYNVYSSKESKIMDSVCKVERDTLFKYAVDSIKKVRISEIEQLINH